MCSRRELLSVTSRDVPDASSARRPPSNHALIRDGRGCSAPSSGRTRAHPEPRDEAGEQARRAAYGGLRTLGGQPGELGLATTLERGEVALTFGVHRPGELRVHVAHGRAPCGGWAFRD